MKHEVIGSAFDDEILRGDACRDCGRDDDYAEFNGYPWGLITYNFLVRATHEVWDIVSNISPEDVEWNIGFNHCFVVLGLRSDAVVGLVVLPRAWWRRGLYTKNVLVVDQYPR
ncbi:hypothetical protein C2S51_038042 [Perilla frutescens var. frutescens]|nr:hypothetical protein C2S51_038042 [Perilla frutescens var. frutescens]